jgi:hypothetical protein
LFHSLSAFCISLSSIAILTIFSVSWLLITSFIIFSIFSCLYVSIAAWTSSSFKTFSVSSFSSRSFFPSSKEIVLEFFDLFCSLSITVSTRSFLVPVFIVSLPACTLGDHVSNQATHNVSNLFFIMKYSMI